MHRHGHAKNAVTHTHTHVARFRQRWVAAALAAVLGFAGAADCARAGTTTTITDARTEKVQTADWSGDKVYVTVGKVGEDLTFGSVIVGSDLACVIKPNTQLYVLGTNGTGTAPTNDTVKVISTTNTAIKNAGYSSNTTAEWATIISTGDNGIYFYDDVKTLNIQNHSVVSSYKNSAIAGEQKATINVYDSTLTASNGACIKLSSFYPQNGSYTVCIVDSILGISPDSITIDGVNYSRAADKVSGIANSDCNARFNFAGNNTVTTGTGSTYAAVKTSGGGVCISISGVLTVNNGSGIYNFKENDSEKNASNVSINIAGELNAPDGYSIFNSGTSAVVVNVLNNADIKASANGLYTGSLAYLTFGYDSTKTNITHKRFSEAKLAEGVFEYENDTDSYCVAKNTNNGDSLGLSENSANNTMKVADSIKAGASGGWTAYFAAGKTYLTGAEITLADAHIGAAGFIMPEGEEKLLLCGRTTDSSPTQTYIAPNAEYGFAEVFVGDGTGASAMTVTGAFNLNSGSALTVKNASSLTVNGAVAIAGNLVLDSGSVFASGAAAEITVSGGALVNNSATLVNIARAGSAAFSGSGKTEVETVALATGDVFSYGGSGSGSLEVKKLVFSAGSDAIALTNNGADSSLLIISDATPLAKELTVNGSGATKFTDYSVAAGGKLNLAGAVASGSRLVLDGGVVNSTAAVKNTIDTVYSGTISGSGEVEVTTAALSNGGALIYESGSTGSVDIKALDLSAVAGAGAALTNNAGDGKLAVSAACSLDKTLTVGGGYSSKLADMSVVENGTLNIEKPLTADSVVKLDGGTVNAGAGDVIIASASSGAVNAIVGISAPGKVTVTAANLTGELVNNNPGGLVVTTLAAAGDGAALGGNRKITADAVDLGARALANNNTGGLEAGTLTYADGASFTGTGKSTVENAALDGKLTNASAGLDLHNVSVASGKTGTLAGTNITIGAASLDGGTLICANGMDFTSVTSVSGTNTLQAEAGTVAVDALNLVGGSIALNALAGAKIVVAGELGISSGSYSQSGDVTISGGIAVLAGGSATLDATPADNYYSLKGGTITANADAVLKNITSGTLNGTGAVTASTAALDGVLSASNILTLNNLDIASGKLGSINNSENTAVSGGTLDGTLSNAGAGALMVNGVNGAGTLDGGTASLAVSDSSLGEITASGALALDNVAADKITSSSSTAVSGMVSLNGSGSDLRGVALDGGSVLNVNGDTALTFATDGWAGTVNLGNGARLTADVSEMRGTLSGNGSVLSDLTVAGIVAPGMGGLTLGNSGTTTFNAGSTLNLGLGKDGDRTLTVNGTLDFAGTVTGTITAARATAAGGEAVITANSVTNKDNYQYTLSSSVYDVSATWDDDANPTKLLVAAAPKPSVYEDSAVSSTDREMGAAMDAIAQNGNVPADLQAVFTAMGSLPSGQIGENMRALNGVRMTGATARAAVQAVALSNTALIDTIGSVRLAQYAASLPGIGGGRGPARAVGRGAAGRGIFPIFPGFSHRKDERSSLGGTPHKPDAVAAKTGNRKISEEEQAVAVMAGTGVAPMPSAEKLCDCALQNRAWGGMFKAYGGFGHQGKIDDYFGYDFAGAGVLAGLDYTFGSELTAGALVDYSYNRTSLYEDAGYATDHLLRLGGYASYGWDGLFVDFSPSCGLHLLSHQRKISLTHATAKGDRVGFDCNLLLNGGYRFELPHDLTLTPQASLSFTYFRDPDYKETGNALTPVLKMRGCNTFSLQQDLQLKLGKIVRLPGARSLLVPEIFAGWEHEYLAGGHDVSMSFSSAPSYGWTSRTGKTPADRAVFGAGLTTLFSERWAASGAFTQKIWDGGSSSSFSLSVQFHF